jgi:hypothetical protein
MNHPGALCASQPSHRGLIIGSEGYDNAFNGTRLQ